MSKRKRVLVFVGWTDDIENVAFWNNLDKFHANISKHTDYECDSYKVRITVEEIETLPKGKGRGR